MSTDGCRRSLWFFTVSAVLGWSIGQMQAATAFHTAAAVRNLSRDEAAKAYPVVLDAVVTFYDSRAPASLFVRDSTAGIFVETEGKLPIVPGSRVLVRGVTAGDFTNTITKSSVVEISRGPLPAPRRVPLNDFLAGEEDCEYIQVTGRIRTAFVAVEEKSSFLELRLDISGKPVDIQVESYPPALDLDTLIDATVTVRGAAGGSFNDQQRLVGVIVNAQSYSDIEFQERSRQNLYASPLIPVGEVLKYRLSSKAGQRAHVRGIVTYYRPGEFLTIQDHGSALRIYSRQSSSVTVGDLVDVTGFPGFGEGSPVLEDGNFRRSPLHSAAPASITPTVIPATKAAAAKFDSRLVSVDAELLSVFHSGDNYVLALVDKDIPFSATMDHAVDPREIKALIEGSVLRISGICAVETAGMWKTVRGFHILMRSSRDIRVLRLPPWWNSRKLIYLLAGLGALVVMGCSWIAVLRSRVSAQTSHIHRVMKEEADRERRTARLQLARSQVLERINSREPLPAVLGAIAALPEQYFPGLQCSIFLTGENGHSTLAAGTLKTLSSSDCSKAILAADGRADEHVALGTIAAVKCHEAAEEELSEILSLAAQLAAFAIDNRKLYDGLRDRSLRDALTGLPNRILLTEHFRSEMECFLKTGRKFAILYLDVNDFKTVNDSYGHNTGDLFLLALIHRFQASLREVDVLARIGGDEFVGLLPGVGDCAEAAEIGQRIGPGLAKPLLLENGLSLTGSVSIGVALFPEDGANLDALLHHADKAMYAAKRSRKAPAFSNTQVVEELLSLPV